jgi:hypothetical protein
MYAQLNQPYTSSATLPRPLSNTQSWPVAYIWLVLRSEGIQQGPINQATINHHQPPTKPPPTKPLLTELPPSFAKSTTYDVTYPHKPHRHEPNSLVRQRSQILPYRNISHTMLSEARRLSAHSWLRLNEHSEDAFLSTLSHHRCFLCFKHRHLI